MTKPQEKRQERILPVIPLQQELPLLDDNLSWERFEEFCPAFVGKQPGVRRVSRYGKRGSKQRGIDFIAEMESGEKWSFQCRQWKEFSASQFERTVRENTYGAARNIVVIACHAGTPLRDAEKARPDWEVWDAADVSRKVRELPIHVQRQLVAAHFGQYVQEAFVGVKGPTAFREWSEHFAPYMRGGRLFHHRTPLVGRDELIDQLERFVDDGAGRLIVISGRGGIGKTKLLHRFGEDHLTRRPTRHLLYADEETPFTAETLEDIPSAESTIVVDDAHRREDLGELLAMVSRWSAPIKVVLAIRPEGKERLAALIARSAIDVSEVIWLPDLLELPRGLGQELAEKALGEELRYLSQRLYQATWDCPLVTVVGSELLRSKQLAPEVLERDEDFRRAVLGKFASAALSGLETGLSEQQITRVLELISALQPVRPDDARFLQAAAAFLDMKEADLVRTVDRLEESGLLLRRGYRVRIVPDVLGDHFLSEACLTSKGETTGYVDRLLEEFSSVAFDRLLANIAELDWRVRVTSQKETPLLDRFWELIEAEFRTGSDTAQAAILRMLKDAAIFQPARVLELVEYSMVHPATAPQPSGVSSLYLSDRDAVVQLLAELVDRSAHGGHIRRAARILWQLGRDDARETGRFPNHPIRLLSELIGYEPGKPLEVSSDVLSEVEELMNEAGAHEHVHSPLKLVEPLLAKTGIDHSSDGASIHMRPFSVNPVGTGGLRQRGLEVLKKAAMSDELRIALSAMKVLEAGLHGPFGFLNHKVSEEESRGWLGERLAILQVFEQLARRNEMPVLQISVSEAVVWAMYRDPSSEVRQAAEGVRKAIPDTFEIRMLQALTKPWGNEVDMLGTGDIEAAEQLRTARMRACADELARSKPDGETLVEYLRGQIEVLESAAVTFEGGYLVGLLAERNPQLASEAAGIVAQSPGHPLEQLIGQLLLGVRPNDPDRALEIAESVVKAGSRRGLQAIAMLYAYWGWVKANPQPGDTELLELLLSSEYDEVRGLAVRGLRSLAEHDAGAVIRLAIETRLGSSAMEGQALAELLDPAGSVFSQLSEAELEKLLARLEALDTLDEYHLRRLLKGMVGCMPMKVLEMLLRRIDRTLVGGFRMSYQALPMHPALEPLWNEVDGHTRLELLVRVRLEALDRHGVRALDLPRLYAALAGDWDEAARLLVEWIESEEEAKVRAAAVLFSHAPPDYAFENVAVVERCFNAAAKTGEKGEKALESAFWGSVHSGGGSGRMLQPMPRDVEVRDRSLSSAQGLRAGSPAERFFRDLAKNAEDMIEHERKVDEELVEGPLPPLGAEG